MTVNKEVVSKVLAYMDSVTDTWLQKRERDTFRVKFDKDARFSFYRFAVENDLLHEAKEGLYETTIPCPFHRDDSPSNNFNDKMHRYHCFSCGCGGNIINFMMEYDNRVNGVNTSYYQKMNDILINDKEMQAHVGATTIYAFNEVFDLEKGLKPFKPKLSKAYIPSTYAELSTRMIKEGCTIEQIKYYFLLMQSGMSAKDCYKEIFSVELPDVDAQEYDLQKMMLD